MPLLERGGGVGWRCGLMKHGRVGRGGAGHWHSGDWAPAVQHAFFRAPHAHI